MGDANEGKIEFGHRFREHFLFGSEYINLNHGSFGAVPRSVMSAQHAQQLAIESSPDRFLRYNYTGALTTSRTAIAQYLGVSPDTCVFVQNATLGLNTVLRNLRLDRPNTCVVYFDTIYGAIEKTLVSICETSPNLALRKVDDYTLPCTHDDIVAALLRTIQAAEADGLQIRACVFETIASMPAARFPFEAITEICKGRGILSVVDGAHGVGQVPIDLAKLDPDFFVSNCHKWLYTPRGCAVLYVPRRNQHLIRTTLPTSWGFVPLPVSSSDGLPADSGTQNSKVQGNIDAANDSDQDPESTRFADIFAYVGTADSTAYYVLPAALDFRKNVCGGEDRIYAYTQWIAQAGADLLALRLGTEVMDASTQPGKAGGRHDEGDETRRQANETEPPSPRDSRGQGDFNPEHKWRADDVCEIRRCAMANVRLPFKVATTTTTSTGDDSHTATPNPPSSFPPISIHASKLAHISSHLTQLLNVEHNLAVSISPYRDAIWLRVSGQIYLELRDFAHLADVLMRVLEDVRTSQRWNGDSG